MRAPVTVMLSIAFAFPGCQAMRNAGVTCAVDQMKINGVCYCPNGQTWNGVACQGTPDFRGCQGNSVWFGPAAGGSCRCMAGYTVNASTNTCDQLSCTGGSVASGNECACPNNLTWDGAQCSAPSCPAGTTWDGSACACPNGALWNQTQCECPDGTSWDGTQCAAAATAAGPACEGGSVWNGTDCVCENSTWNGSQCVGAAAAPSAQRKPRRSCRTALLDKGYGPERLASCNNVNDRCALALIDKGYDPARLSACRLPIDSNCAEDLIRQGYGPERLASCRR
jgi:hypothetical protein